MISEIRCDKCNAIMGYTNINRIKIKMNYLFSEKLSVAQKGAYYDRRKFMYCVMCYNTIMHRETTEKLK